MLVQIRQEGVRSKLFRKLALTQIGRKEARFERFNDVS
jgi:hypothetical protein